MLISCIYYFISYSFGGWKEKLLKDKSVVNEITG